MSSGREELIRARAYELWERQGRPAGREGENWEQAEREIDSEASQFSSQQANAGEPDRRDGGGNSQMTGSEFSGNAQSGTSDFGPERRNPDDGAPAAAKRPRKPRARKE